MHCFRPHNIRFADVLDVDDVHARTLASDVMKAL